VFSYAAKRRIILLIGSRSHLLAPATAAILIAQQVASNASRDGLLLSAYPLTAFPYFVAGASLVAIPVARASGQALTRYGPARVVPVLLAFGALLFVAEWALLGFPKVASAILYVHSSVLGGIGISGFWSLMNERFDPHSAKALIARTAAAATLGGLLGGIGAERVVAVFTPGALLLVMAGLGVLTTMGVLSIIRGRDATRLHADTGETTSPWSELRRTPLLRDLALVTVLAGAVAALADYFLKAEAVAWLGKGEPLVRFFGIFYAVTGVGSFLLQAALGRIALSRLGLGGSVASHSVVVGTAGLLGVVVPGPWRGIFPRALDMTIRNSIFRAGYELLYTPLPPSAKRSVKSLIDVIGDSAGKAAGAGLALLLTRLGPVHSLVAVNIAVVAAAAAEFAFARRLRAEYVTELGGGLRRQQSDLQQAAQLSLADFTMVRSFAGLDVSTLQHAIQEPAPDPVAASFIALRSGDSTRIRSALATLPLDPTLIGALVPLLANRHILRQTTDALKAFGPRAAGELVSALLDSDTPDVVRRRLPIVLESCGSPVARDGLVAALVAEPLEVRSRSARALLALTEKYPLLAVPSTAAIAAAERQLRSAETSREVRDFIFNLLALGFEREPMRIAARAFDSDDPWLRGTSLEYLETVLPHSMMAALSPVLKAPASHVPRREASAVRADLLKAGATMTVSLAEVRRQLEALNKGEEGGTS
jgi:hypothetical protein